MNPDADVTATGPRAGREEKPSPPVVVGVDDSDSARHAAEWAAELASAWRAPLHLVHATATTADRLQEPPWLRELRAAAQRTGVEEVASRVVAGPAASELTDRSRDAGMIVVGSYGEGARAGMLAGSAALTLVEEAECPVAVVRGSTAGLPPPRSGPVLVGTDGVTDDDAALHLGAALAVALGARLSVLHAWSDVTEDTAGLHRATASGTELAALAVQRLDRCLAPLRAAYPGLPVERHVVDDTALRALLAQASGARAVVVAHRRGSASRRLGSTSRGLVAFAPCPVVVADPSRGSIR
jgi:nucleotide-binding universal stress UspA family protein